MSVKDVKSSNTKIIGLTGGIATGKTTASKYLKSKGLKVIDSDLIVRDLYAYHEGMIEQIHKTFGIWVRNQQDKKLLSQLIFSDEKKREQLNKIIHPYVFQKIEDEISNAQDLAHIIIDMPLLFEVGYEKNCDLTILIYAPLSIQIQRLIERDQISEHDAIKRIKSQMSIENKKQKADIIVDNQSDLEHLYKSLDQILGG